MYTPQQKINSKEDILAYLRTQNPNNIIAALRALDFSIRVKPVGVDSVQADVIKKYIKENTCIQLAYKVAKESATGQRKTVFNALTHIDKEDTSFKIGSQTFETEHVRVSYADSVTKLIDGKAETIAPTQLHLLSRMAGNVKEIVNNTDGTIVHKGAMSAIPSTYASLFKANKDAVKGASIRHDSMSDVVFDAFKAAPSLVVNSSFQTYLAEVPRIPSGEAKKPLPLLKFVVTEKATKEKPATGELKKLTPQPGKLVPFTTTFVNVEQRYRDSLPSSGLGGRPVLNYFGVPMGNSTTHIEHLTLLRDSHVDPSLTIISTCTNPTVAAFIRNNGYPNFYHVTDRSIGQYGMTSVAFSNLKNSKVVFHPQPIIYGGKKGLERDTTKEILVKVGEQFGVTLEHIIYVSTLSTVSCGICPYAYIDTIDESEELKLETPSVFRTDKHVIRYLPTTEIVEKTEEELKKLSKAQLTKYRKALKLASGINSYARVPARDMTYQELLGVYVKGIVSICTATGPFALFSPYVPPVHLTELTDSVVNGVTRVLFSAFYPISLTDEISEFKLLTRPVGSMIDFESVSAGVYSSTVITELFTESRKKPAVARPHARGPTANPSEAKRGKLKRKEKEKEKSASSDDDTGSSDSESSTHSGGDDDDDAYSTTTMTAYDADLNLT